VSLGEIIENGLENSSVELLCGFEPVRLPVDVFPLDTASFFERR
jgi:hypothetical protein